MKRPRPFNQDATYSWTDLEPPQSAANCDVDMTEQSDTSRVRQKNSPSPSKNYRGADLGFSQSHEELREITYTVLWPPTRIFVSNPSFNLIILGRQRFAFMSRPEYAIPLSLTHTLVSPLGGDSSPKQSDPMHPCLRTHTCAIWSPFAIPADSAFLVCMGTSVAFSTAWQLHPPSGLQSVTFRDIRLPFVRLFSDATRVGNAWISGPSAVYGYFAISNGVSLDLPKFNKSA
ncbi:hypothetical protein AB1N83_005271 [Pleurotus pulmonarius]